MHNSVGKFTGQIFPSAGLGNIAATLEPWDEFADYKKFISKALPESKVRDHIVDHWREDAEFGRQMLNGVCPNLIERCDALPENFPLEEEALQGILKRDMSLDQEMKVSIGMKAMCSHLALSVLPNEKNEILKNE